MEESLIKKLITSIKCDACGQYYLEDCIDIIEHKEDLWFLKVFCSFCHVRSLVAAIIKEDKKAEVITDLTEAELDKFRDMERVRVDDVLDMHNFLKDFDGDFPRLFRQR
jgi:Pyruvate/2-oxoacid:ferredoxin oxidoreductase delta subunit